MPGFDWNGNGKKDSFDRFMDRKVISEASSKKNRASAKKTEDICSADFQAQNKQQSDGTVALKSLLAVGLVFGALAACTLGETGKLGTGLLLVGAAVCGYFIIR